MKPWPQLPRLLNSERYDTMLIIRYIISAKERAYLMKTANTLLIKEINLNIVRKQLLSLKTATKQQLAQLTGLSLMTVSSIISELIDNGEVVEGNWVKRGG